VSSKEAIDTDAQKQLARDLRSLSTGTTLWQYPNKKGVKVSACFLSLVPTKSAPSMKKTISASILAPMSPKRSDHKPVAGAESWTIVLDVQRKKTYFKLFEEATIEVCIGDPRLLTLSGLDFAGNMRLSLVQNKKKLDMVCLMSEDFECWDRVLATLYEQHFGFKPESSRTGESKEGSGSRDKELSRTRDVAANSLSTSGEFSLLDDSDRRSSNFPRSPTTPRFTSEETESRPSDVQ